jgi:arginase
VAAGTRRLAVCGAPTSAGSHNPGQDKAPSALRAAGLVARLGDAGADVVDLGDTDTHVHRPTQRGTGIRDVHRVRTAAEQAAGLVSEALAQDRVAVVLGGDCTITLGVVSAVRRSGPVSLVYVDGDADLSEPATSSSRIADTMGVTHLLGGGDAALSQWGGDTPLLLPEQLVLLGFDPEELDTRQWERLLRHGLLALPVGEVVEDPAAAARRALSQVQGGGGYVVHVDVDVLDTGAFPLANFPHFNGMTLDELRQVLEVLTAGDGLAALVLTEVNPDHDPDGSLVERLVQVVVAALGRSV